MHIHKKGSEKSDGERRMVDAKSIIIDGNEWGREIGKSKMGEKTTEIIEKGEEGLKDERSLKKNKRRDTEGEETK